MRIPSLLLPAVLAPLLISLPLAAQTEGPKIRDLPVTPVADADDPVNRYVATQTVDGLVLSVTIDGPNVTLDQAVPARVRKTVRRPTGTGDYAPVTALGFAGGTRISEAIVADSVVRALDDWNTPHQGALVRVMRRQIVIPLAASRALDTVEVTAPATGAHATLDVRAAYAEYCRAGMAAPGRENPMCPAGAGDQKPR